MIRFIDISKSVVEANAIINLAVPGDVVSFQKGGKWSGQIVCSVNGTSLNPIIINSYGSGLKPIITTRVRVPGSDVSGNWSNVSGNIWKLSLPTPNNVDFRIWVDSVEKNKVASSELLTALKPVCYTTASPFLYIYSTVNPSSLLIEYPGTEGSLKIENSNYITVDGLEVQAGLVSIDLIVSNNIVIKNSVVGLDTNRMGIRGGAGCKYITVESNYIGSGDQLKDEYQEFHSIADGVFIPTGCKGWKVCKNIIDGWGHSCVGLANQYDFEDTSMTDNEVYENFLTSPNTPYCRAFSCDSLAGRVSTGNKIYRNYAYRCSVRSQLNCEGLEFSYNILNETTNSIYTGIDGIQGDGQGIDISGYDNTSPKNMNIHNNIIANSKEAGIRINHGEGFGELSGNEFVNNILFNNGMDSFYAPNVQVSFEIYDVAIGDNHFENNILYKNGETDLIYDNRSLNNFLTISEWQDGNYIKNNLNVNPLFLDGLNNNLIPSESSPALGAGKNLGNNFNKSINYTSVWPQSVQTIMQGVNWNIGAFKKLNVMNYTSIEELTADINAVITGNGNEGISGPKLNKILVGITEFYESGATGATGATGPTGATGTAGLNGWSMIPALVSDGSRKVIKIIDWFGGTGTKPNINIYIAANGFTSDIAQAVDIRGATGATGASGTGGGGAESYSATQVPQWVESVYSWNGKLITDAMIDNLLFAKQGATFYRRFLPENKADASWWGMKDHVNYDQFTVFQQAVTDCIKWGLDLILPEGVHQISTGISVVRADGQVILDVPFVSINIYGRGNAFDPVGLGVGTGIKITDGSEAALFLQKVKGVTIQDIHFYGMNTDLSSYTREQIYSSYNNGVGAGISNSATAPHTAIAVDPWYTGSTANKYPKHTARYIEPVGNGSTGVKIIDCYFQEFATGISVSAGGMQNGEQFEIIRPSFTACSSAFTSGDVQNRTLKIYDYMGWGNILYHFNTRDYSAGGAGCPPAVYGLNIAGNTKSLCKLGGFYGNTLYVYGTGHTELMKDIYGCHEGRSCNIHLEGCQLYFTGSLYENSIRTRYPNQLAQCRMITFNNCLLTYYTNDPTNQTLMSFMCDFVKVSNSELSAPIMVNNGVLKYDFAILQRFNKLLDTMSIVSSTTVASTVFNINDTAGTYQYTDTSGTAVVGAYVRLFPKTAGQLRPFAFTGELNVPGGQVVARSGNTVTVFGIVDGLANGMNFDITADNYILPS